MQHEKKQHRGWFEWLGERLGVDRQVMALSIARLADAAGNSILFVVIPIYIVRLPDPVLSLPRTFKVGVVISVYGLIATIFQPLLGSLIDRVGKMKLFIQIGLALMGLGTFAYIFASQALWVLVFRVTQGLGLGITVPATFAMMAVITRKESRGRAMGFLSSMRMLGFAVGPLVGGYLATHVSFMSCFLSGGGLILVAILLVQLWLKEEAKPSRSGGPGFFDRRIWSPSVLCAAASTVTMASAFTAISTFESRFNARLGESAFAFGLAFSATTASRLIFQIPLGWFSDREGRKPSIIGGLILMAFATALMGWVSATWQLVVLRALQGIAAAGIAAPALALAADTAHESARGRQMSIVTSGFSLGLALGPLIAGVLGMTSFVLPFLLIAAACILSAWIVFQFAPETVNRSTADRGERRAA